MTVRETIDPNSSLWAWLAYDLWFHRTQRGLSLARTALVVRVARGTVSNWEAGRHRPNDDHMALLDRAWNTGGHFQRLMYYARTGHDPDWFRQYVQYEAAAEVIKVYNGKNVPLLVQTEAYAQAILKTDGSARPYVWILIDQEVLECPVGSKEVMAGQLRHLLGAEDDARLSVRVILRSAGHHPGHDGPFQILKVNGREVAYAGAQIGGRLIEAAPSKAWASPATRGGARPACGSSRPPSTGATPPC
ncbi:helix-turn-helix transcriptional regulator [Actinomadura sp. LOL_016]|uniref:helix-turn-helix domain-containing protein n=1 Tax=unclassified Actinomadura TaxID=2626254 RepID=UPI003A811DA2